MSKSPSDLPGLDSCLRQPVEHYKAARRTVWDAARDHYFAELTAADRQALSRLCDPEMREVDEALLRGLKAQPDLASEAQVPIDLFENTLLLESAGAQLERVATGLLHSLVDCQLVLRHGLFLHNGAVEQTVATLYRDPKTPWWQAAMYHALWSEVEVLEHSVLDREAGIMGRRDARNSELANKLAELSDQDLADLALLEEVVGSG